MPPDRLDTSADVNRSRSRREPSPLEQIPVWDGFVSDVASDAIQGDPPAGLDALLGGLNPEQLRAVTHGDGPLLVVAGAGTGKTQVITRRIAWLIATRRAKPSEILALTFTDKAAEEMARVERAAQAAARVWSFTKEPSSVRGDFGAQELGYRPGPPRSLASGYPLRWRAAN